MPIGGDPRALDGLLAVGGSSIGVEAETRLGDVQAVDRRIQLKKRDARLDRLILLVADTRFNRLMLERHREALRASYPLDTKAVVAALARADAPSADGIVVL